MADPLDNLSPREREIVGYVKEGFTTGEIARQLGISVRTVEAHLGIIRRKLDAWRDHDADSA